MAAQRLHLAIADPTLPYRLYIDLRDGDAGVILMQGEGAQQRPVAMSGRPATAAELNAIRPKALLSIAVWGIRRFARWTCAATELVVGVPERECLLLCSDKEVHPKLRAQVIELEMYRARLVLNEAAWDIGAKLVEMDCERPPPPLSGGTPPNAP